jgi:hypothetical protein
MASPLDNPVAGINRYYLFNSLLHMRKANELFALNNSDGSNLDITLDKINGLVEWEFTAYYLRIVYWPLATETELLDLQIDKILRKRTAISCELFPYASDKQVYPYTVDELKIIPAETLPGAQPCEFTEEELLEGQRAAGFKPDRFTKAPQPVSHRRVYDFRAPIVELSGGEYNREVFRKLVEPIEEELMLLNGVLAARVVREQVEVTYRAGLPLEVLDHFVGGVMGRFYTRTEGDMTVFYQLKKGAPLSLRLTPRQACTC